MKDLIAAKLGDRYLTFKGVILDKLRYGLLWYEVIHSVHTQDFPKNSHFLHPDTYTPSCAYQGVRNVSFSENFAYILNE